MHLLNFQQSKAFRVLRFLIFGYLFHVSSAKHAVYNKYTLILILEQKDI